MSSSSSSIPPSSGFDDRPSGVRSAGPIKSLADYRILQEIGRGGQGIVYLAEDHRHKKRVALKVLKSGAEFSTDALERLRREVEAAARLHHPGICAVHEAVLDGPSPFIAMNYVEGQSLAQTIAAALQPGDRTWVVRDGPPDSGVVPGDAHESAPATQRPASGPSTRRDILRIVAIIEKAARALHAAHEARIIHRDIKPSNIIVTPEGEPVVLDFGLAHFEESGLLKLTQPGEIWGTPAYLSPEQLQSAKMKVDRRTDVWSLGVTLYECLTLRRPFEGPTHNEIFNAIQSKDPPDPCKLNRSLPSDLRVILETALEKDRDRRYETALAFAEDLKALREDRQIAARPIGTLTRLSRWTRRNPAVAASVLFTFGILVAGIVVAMSLVIALNATLAEKSVVLDQRDEESRQKDAALRHSEGLRLLAESSAALSRDPGLALLLALEGAELAPDTQMLANGAANNALSEIRERRTLIGHHDAVDAAEFSPDGRRVVTSSADGEVRIWDSALGTLLGSIRHARVIRAAFTRSAERIVTLATDGTARIWNADTWDEIARLGEPEPVDGNGNDDGTRSRGQHPLPETGSPQPRIEGRLPGVLPVSLSLDTSRLLSVSGREGAVWDMQSGLRISKLGPEFDPAASVTLSSNGSRILTVSAREAAVWDAETGERIAHSPTPFPNARLARFSGDARRIVVASGDKGWIWDYGAGRIIAIEDLGPNVRSLAFSEDGRRVLEVGRDTVSVHLVESGKSRRLCGRTPAQNGRDARHDSAQPQAAFTRDGLRVVGASCDGTAHVWSVEDGSELAILSGQSGDVRFVAVSPDGSLVLTGSSSGTITLWDTVRWAQVATLRGHGGDIRSAAFSPDGTLIVTASSDLTARIWDARLTFGAPLLEGHQGAVTDVVFSPDGSLIATASSDGNPRLWATDGARPVAQLGGRIGQSNPQFSPDGGRIITLCEDGSTGLFDGQSGAAIATMRGASAFLQMAFSPDGRLVVTASEEGAGSVWDARGGTEISQLTGHRGAVIFVGFAAGGARVVTAGEDRTVRLWDPRSGVEIASMPEHRSHPPAVSPDGTRLAVTSPDGDLRICDAMSGGEVARLPGSRHGFPRFSPDGRRLATESPDGTFRAWDTSTASEVSAVPRDEGDHFHGFSPDGASFLTSARNGTVQHWETASGRRLAVVRGHGAPQIEASYSPDGRRILLSSPDETRLCDASSGADVCVIPRRHGDIRVARFSPNGSWIVAGYTGGLARLWPVEPLARARSVLPRELSLQEIEAHGIDDAASRADIRSLFDDFYTNEELSDTLARRSGLSGRLRRAAITAAHLRDPRLVAEKLRRRSWMEALKPYGSPEALEISLKRARIAHELDPRAELGLITLGAAQYRAGRFLDALATLREAAQRSSYAPTSIFIGLAHAKLGQAGEAAAALANARRLLEASGSRYSDDIRRLLDEADGLLNPDSRPAHR